MPDYENLRALTVPHRAEANCGTCDERWEKIREEVDRVVEDQLTDMLAGGVL